MEFITVGIQYSDILKELVTLAAGQPTVDEGYAFIRIQLDIYDVPHFSETKEGLQELHYNEGYISAFHDGKTNAWRHFDH